MELEQTRVLENSEIAPGIFMMALEAPKIAPEARAGQFVMVYLSTGELLLPRPISICNTRRTLDWVREPDETKYIVELVYQVVGKGTKVMSEIRPGKTVTLLGPLGKGFYTKPKVGSPCPDQARTPLGKVALVGGGIGTPPLLLLARTLKAQGATVDVYLGFRQHPILVGMFESVADSVRISTEQGLTGHRGNILEVIQAHHTQYDEILTCGPLPMLKAVAAYAASHNIPCQMSVEERMACGLGTCVGCALKVNGTNLRICTEGPVFYSDEVNSHE